MAANLTAKFKLIDEMSDKLDKIAQGGRNALSAWESAGSAIDSAFSGATHSTTATQATIDKATQSVEEFDNAASKAASSAEEVSAAMDKMENDTNGVAEASDELTEGSKKAEDALEDVAEDADKAGEKIDEYGRKSEESGEKSEQFGKKASEAIGAVEQLLVSAGIVKGLEKIGEAFTSAVNDAIEFESAMTGVFKTVDGTDEQLAQITSEISDMSLRMPASTTEIAGVAEAAGQLGIATEDVTAFTEVMINLGEATNLTADEASSSLAKFANITGTTADKYENLGSTVVALGNNFATTEADIVRMSTRMASAATLAGMTEADILALAASLSSVGIEADAGGSSMSTLISKIQLAVETGSEELDSFASVAGMSAEQFKTAWGDNAAQALYQFIDGLNDVERNGASATAILDDMGITEIRLSNAVKALANNSESFGESLTFASEAWEENTALAQEANTRYATLESKLAMTKNAATALGQAVGQAFTPLISKAATVGQGVLTGLTQFVRDHPNVVRAIAAVAAGVAAFTVAVTAYTIATKAAAVAQAALNAILDTNPFYLIASAIVAATVALVGFVAAMAAAEDDGEKLSYASRQQAEEIENLQSQYDSVAETYGESSYQAQELQMQIDELTAKYDANKRTMNEWKEQFDNAMSSYKEFSENRSNSISEAELEGDKILNLATRLNTLAEKSDLSASEQQELLAIMKALNTEIPSLGLSYDEATGKINATKDAVIALATAEANRRKYDTYNEQLIASIGKRTELNEALTLATEEQTAALAAQQQAEIDLQEAQAYANRQWPGSTPNGPEQTYRHNYLLDYESAVEEASAAVEEANGQVEEANAAIAENEAAIESLTGKMAEAKPTADDMIAGAESTTEVIDGMAAAVSELKESYDEAYNAAYESFSGQFGLFDEAKANMEATVSAAQTAMDSQLEYWTTYASNVEVLKNTSASDLGITQENYTLLMSYVQDGSAEAAGLAQSMVTEIQNGNSAAVTELANTVGEVESKRQEAAGKVAEWKIDFDGKMDAILAKAQSTVDGMNLSSEAAAAATATINSYAAAIKTAGGAAIANAQSIASQVKAALSSASTTINIGTSTGKGYATGTESATPGIHLVGENGPELIAFDGGERVYNTEETEQIIARSDAAKVAGDTGTGSDGDSRQSGGGDSKRTIELVIDGHGAIDISEGVDTETVVAILQQYLKPVLMDVVEQEILEEGDDTYDF